MDLSHGAGDVTASQVVESSDSLASDAMPGDSTGDPKHSGTAGPINPQTGTLDLDSTVNAPLPSSAQVQSSNSLSPPQSGVGTIMEESTPTSADEPITTAALGSLRLVAIDDGETPKPKSQQTPTKRPFESHLSKFRVSLSPPTINNQTQSMHPKESSSPKSHKSVMSSDLSDLDPSDFAIDFDYDGDEQHRILRLKPTVDQWKEFPALLEFARSRGADEDGCFKVNLPEALQDSLPERESQLSPANAYKPKQLKKNSIWRVDTVSSMGSFSSTDFNKECTTPALEAIQKLKKLFHLNNDKQLRNIRYRPDVPAWTAEQRQTAGVPARSPIHPLKGDKLDHTKAIVPGIHTPYVYESAPHFGAPFQIHAEDYRLVSLNHLYKGRKIWIVIPSTAVDLAELALDRKKKCSQFMRHRGEFLFPSKLKALGIPFRVVDQRPGETMVILPDAYHEGFSTGYTIAEAKNYAEASWTTDKYQPCVPSCKLATAIPDEYMRPLAKGEKRLDLCAIYKQALMELDELDDSDDSEEPPKPLPKAKAKAKVKTKVKAIRKPTGVSKSKAASKPKAASTKPKAASSKPKAASSKPKAASSKPKAAPKPKPVAKTKPVAKPMPTTRKRRQAEGLGDEQDKKNTKRVKV